MMLHPDYLCFATTTAVPHPTHTPDALAAATADNDLRAALDALVDNARRLMTAQAVAHALQDAADRLWREVVS